LAALTTRVAAPIAGRRFGLIERAGLLHFVIV
jgi:hypothetical protein